MGFMFRKDDEYNNDEYNGDYIRPVEEYRYECDDHEHGQTYEDYNSEQKHYDECSDIENELCSYMMPHENFLWTGRKQKGYGMGASCLTMIFPLFWIGFAVFWTLMATAAGGGFMAVFGIPFIIIGIAMLIKFRKMTGGKHTYAITDCRVISVINGTVVSELLENIFNITCTDMGKPVGTVRFSVMRVMAVRNNMGAFSGFYGVKNPDEVCRILSKAVYDRRAVLSHTNQK